jgi:hypothetical protein
MSAAHFKWRHYRNLAGFNDSADGYRERFSANMAFTNADLEPINVKMTVATFIR